MPRISSGLFLSTLFTALSCCGAVDPALLSLAPASTRTVMGINVATARDSDFGRFLLSRLGLEEEGYQRWMQQFGFDPRHDLQSIVIAASPNGDQDPNVVVLARGAFDVQKVTAKAKAKGVTVEPYEGVDIFLNARNPDRHGFAFLGDDLVVLGGAAGIRDVVGNRTHTWSISQQLQDASTLAAADNDVWFASAGPVAPLTRYLPGQAPHSADGSQVLQSILSASGGIRFASLVRITVDAIARSEKDASSLADVVRFATSFVQMQGQSNPNSALLMSALNNLDVSSTGDAFHLVLSVPEASLEQIAANPPIRHRTRPRQQ